jgi:uncharacterized protein (UPF0548 family)
LPAGYGHVRRTVSLGTGRPSFDRASDGLRNWEIHKRSGFAVYPDDVPLSMDRTVLVLLQIGPAVAVAPCRVVYLVDEPDRFGFAYGTLPGHPESGEEAFIVDRLRGGAVQFTITAFSRPIELLPRLGGPITRLVQSRATNAYLRAMETIAAGS